MSPDIYTTLGNPVRARLILCLAHGAKNVTQLIATCGLSQSAVSQHLMKLKAAGLVRTQKEGKEVWYFVKHKEAVDVSRLLTNLEKEVL